MSTDQTPALDRATEAHETANIVWHRRFKRYEPVAPQAEFVTHATVSAALHNPDDPDWLARVIYEHFPHGRLTVGGEAEIVPWSEVETWKRDQITAAADAVRAAILGEA